VKDKEMWRHVNEDGVADLACDYRHDIKAISTPERSTPLFKKADLQNLSLQRVN
jgi:hypothetical protein